MDCKHDDLSERRTGHLNCKAARTISAQPEPCPPRGRPKVCLQLKPRSGVWTAETTATEC